MQSRQVYDFVDFCNKQQIRNMYVIYEIILITFNWKFDIYLLQYLKNLLQSDFRFSIRNCKFTTSNINIDDIEESILSWHPGISWCVRDSCVKMSHLESRY